MRTADCLQLLRSGTGQGECIITLLSVNAGKHSPIPAVDSDGLKSYPRPRLQQKLGSGEERKFILSQNLSHTNSTVLKRFSFPQTHSQTDRKFRTRRRKPFLMRANVPSLKLQHITKDPRLRSAATCRISTRLRFCFRVS
ncbi:hypothetical protein NQ318_004905 [Aromia moschata]|uniref:Uncharacterized protein n=1 Tax=Aromia moschata TaxID=1265417 RepID=A0AAV8Z251_9CUCU|nr:hypothetical protein NQ318_004905 [Aromia moschata]